MQHMSKIMIIEDDEILNAGLCYNLQKRELEPVPAYTLSDARKRLAGDSFDLILLDVNLPDGDGFEFAGEIKAHHHTPFIFLTAHNLEDEVVEGFHLGADDYITKPFSVKIVMEKIQAVLRRCGERKEDTTYHCGDLHIDFENRIVKKGGENLSLTPTEFQLLQFFCRNCRQILTKELLLENIWDSKGNYVNEHALSLNISRLRNKIEDEEHGYIKTVYGMGYRWMEMEEE